MLSLLLVLQSFVPLQDSRYLRLVADSFNVPHAVVEAVAWMETRDGQNWSRLGPGVIDSTWVSGRLRVTRVCRELGRFQLRGCFDWAKMLSDPVCNRTQLRTDYRVGVHCGVRNLSRLFGLYGNWVDVIQRHNGSGPLARIYLTNALSYVGWRSLNDSSRSLSVLSR